MDAGTLVRDETITLDGVRFHYRDWGDPSAPPVVLLHAYLQHARTWDTLAHDLADRFRVLALDQRGHGESGWSEDYHELRLVGDLAGFVEALALDRFAVVGFSIGGTTAGSYAALYPERVARAVLLECFTAGDDRGDAPWLEEMRAHLATLRSLPASVADPSEAAAAFRPLAPSAQDDDLQRWMRDGMVKGKDSRWSWRYDPAFREPGPEHRLVAPMPVFRHRLRSVTCPVLLVVGADSWMVEPTAQAATLIPDARVVTIPAAGHWVPLDQPTAFGDTVRAFLTEVP